MLKNLGIRIFGFSLICLTVMLFRMGYESGVNGKGMDMTISMFGMELPAIMLSFCLYAFLMLGVISLFNPTFKSKPRLKTQ